MTRSSRESAGSTSKVKYTVDSDEDYEEADAEITAEEVAELTNSKSKDVNSGKEESESEFEGKFIFFQLTLCRNSKCLYPFALFHNRR